MSLELVDTSFIATLTTNLQSLNEQLSTIKEELRNTQIGKLVYNNKELKELLSIEDKTLRRYRDEGKLAFTRESDKYWYTREDINQFLKAHHNEAYSCLN